MASPIFLVSGICWLLMMTGPGESRSLFYRLAVLENNTADKILSATFWALLMFLVFMATLYWYLYAATHHVCILTDVRLFYIQCGCGREVVEVTAGDKSAPDYQKIEMLRKIMGVVQDAAN